MSLHADPYKMISDATITGILVFSFFTKLFKFYFYKTHVKGINFLFIYYYIFKVNRILIYKHAVKCHIMSQHASIHSFVTSVYIYHSEGFQSFTKRTAPLGLERKDYEGKILYYFVSLFCELDQIQQILTKDGGKVRC